MKFYQSSCREMWEGVPRTRSAKYLARFLAFSRYRIIRFIRTRRLRRLRTGLALQRELHERKVTDGETSKSFREKLREETPNKVTQAHPVETTGALADDTGSTVPKTVERLPRTRRRKISSLPRVAAPPAPPVVEIPFAPPIGAYLPPYRSSVVIREDWPVGTTSRQCPNYVCSHFFPAYLKSVRDTEVADVYLCAQHCGCGETVRTKEIVFGLPYPSRDRGDGGSGMRCRIFERGERLE